MRALIGKSFAQGVLVVDVAIDLDEANCRELVDTVAEELDFQTRTVSVIVNLCMCRSIDRAGLEALARCQKIVAQQGGRFGLSQVQLDIKNALHFAGVEVEFEVFPTDLAARLVFQAAS